MLSEKSVCERAEVSPEGTVFLVYSDLILRDGVEVHRSTRRETLFPGQDVSDRPEWVRAQCSALWTPAVIAKWAEETPPI